MYHHLWYLATNTHSDIFCTFNCNRLEKYSRVQLNMEYVYPLPWLHIASNWAQVMLTQYDNILTSLFLARKDIS